MQKEIFGRGSSIQVAEVLSDLGVKKLLLVTGGHSYRESGANTVFDTLLSSFKVSVFNAFSPNIEIQEALAGTELCRDLGAEAILAVGGGSVMDMAKCIAAFTHMPGQEEKLVKGAVDLECGAIPVIAVPTTGGTGSEATHFAVVYVDGSKYSLASQYLLPTASVIDPEFTDSLPPYITACSGFDALCQAIESYWAVGGSIQSRAYAQKAIALLISTLEAVVNRPDGLARDKMMVAANFAGKAINISKTTAPHALSYTITSEYGVAHGHAVAMTLGAFFPYHDPRGDVELNGGLVQSEYASTFSSLIKLLGAKDAMSAKISWYSLMADCGLHCRLDGKAMVRSDAIDRIVSGVNLQRMANNPVVLDPERLKAVLRSIPWSE